MNIFQRQAGERSLNLLKPYFINTVNKRSMSLNKGPLEEKVEKTVSKIKFYDIAEILYRNGIIAFGVAGGATGAVVGMDTGHDIAQGPIAAAIFMPTCGLIGSAVGVAGGMFLMAAFPVTIPCALYWNMNNKKR